MGDTLLINNHMLHDLLEGGVNLTNFFHAMCINLEASKNDFLCFENRGVCRVFQK